MKDIAKLVEKAVKDLFDIEVEPDISIPDDKHGDYATNVALILGKQLNKNPCEVAENIKDWVLKQAQDGTKAEVAGPGFINFTLSDYVLLDSLKEKIYKSDLYKDKVVVFDYSDPNPFKVLHVGHLYTCVVGDAITRLVENAGGKVYRTNFGGDIGLHAAKSLWATMRHKNELEGLTTTNERADWLAERYVEGNSAYSTDDEAKLEIAEVNKKIYQIHADNDHESETAKIYWQTRQWSYDYFDAFYEQIGVKFDKYIPESATVPVGLKVVREQLTKGVYEESMGAVIFDGEKYGLHTRVFINSEGLPTYEAKDVGLIFIKDEDYYFDQSIVITGNEQKEYMKVVLKSIEQYRPDLVEKTLHFTHGLVKLTGGTKMSSREGNVIRAVDALEITKGAFEKEQGDAPSELVLGAIKYAFLKHRIGPDLVYEPESSVSLVGNSGPYLQYAGARAKSILRKVNTASTESRVADLDENERKLALKLARFGEVVEQATHELAPNQICNYLYELAGVFNRFYEVSKVAGDPREQLRAGLVQKYAETLDTGLGLLGIPTVEKM